MVQPLHLTDGEVEARGRGVTRPGSRGSPLMGLVGVGGNGFSGWETGVAEGVQMCLQCSRLCVGRPGARTGGGGGAGAWRCGLGLAGAESGYQTVEKRSSPSHRAGPADPPGPSELCFSIP